jgi:hypothetical protein
MVTDHLWPFIAGGDLAEKENRDAGDELQWSVAGEV